ncbi:MAG: thioesterase family protein [Anaerolineales bacterium]|nr:thioesterase family protein [Anaerolineales bacterium]
MPEFRFYHPIEVRYGDLDPQGHLNNAKYLTYFEQARVHYLLHLGMFKEGQSFTNIGIILAEVKVTFLAPVQYGADVRVGMRISRLGDKSMTAEYTLMDAASNKELATGSAVLVGYDYRTNETIPIPQEWREKIVEFEKMVGF